MSLTPLNEERDWEVSSSSERLNGAGKPGALGLSTTSPHQKVGDNGQLKHPTSEIDAS